MKLIHREPKPLWVKLVIAVIAITILAPMLLSFVFQRHLAALQLTGLLAGCAWLFVCGFFTTFNPLPIARWFARPGTYELLLNNTSAFFRWSLRIAGVVMMLLALFVAAMFWAARNPFPTTR